MNTPIKSCMREQFELFRAGAVVSTLSMLVLLGVILIVMVSGRIDPSFLYAFSLQEADDRPQWIDLEAFEVIRDGYFAEREDVGLDGYRIQESESAFYLGNYDKDQFLDAVEPPDELETPEEALESDTLDGEETVNEEDSQVPVVEDIDENNEAEEADEQAVVEDEQVEEEAGESEEGVNEGEEEPEEIGSEDEEVVEPETPSEVIEVPAQEEGEEEEVNVEEEVNAEEEPELTEEVVEEGPVAENPAPAVDQESPEGPVEEVQETDELSFWGVIKNALFATAQILDEEPAIEVVEEPVIEAEVTVETEVIEETPEPAAEEVSEEAEEVEKSEAPQASSLQGGQAEQEEADVLEEEPEVESLENNEEEALDDGEEGQEEQEGLENEEVEEGDEQVLDEDVQEEVGEGQSGPEVQRPDEEETQEVVEDDEQDESSEEDLEIGEPVLSFEEQLSALQPEALDDESLMMTQVDQVLKSPEDVLIRVGKDGSLRVDAYHPQGELWFGFSALENVQVSSYSGMVHVMDSTSGELVSYFYDEETHSLKEWMVLFEAPENGVYEYQRRLESPELFDLERVESRVWNMRPRIESDPAMFRPALDSEYFEMSTAVVDTEKTVPAGLLRSYYVDGVLTTLFVTQDDFQYPLLVEREWKFPEWTEEDLEFKIDRDEREKLQSQSVLDDLMNLPLHFEKNQSQHDERITFSSRWHLSTFFMRDRELISSWFVPFQDYEMYRDAWENELSELQEDATETELSELIESGDDELLNDVLRGELGSALELVTDDDAELLAADDLVLETENTERLSCPAESSLLSQLLNTSEDPYVFADFQQQFLGALPASRFEGEELVDHVAHYYQGDDPDSWVAGVETSSSLLSRELYPQVDWRILGDYFTPAQEFIMNPGADLSTIRMRFSGAESLQITEAGDLQADLGQCRVVYARPYATTGEEESVSLLPVDYELPREGVVSFTSALDELPAEYRIRMRVLPRLSTCISQPTVSDDLIFLDNEAGNYYVLGNVGTPVSFPIRSDEYQCLTNKDFDARVKKIDYENRQALFTTTFGGSQIDEVQSLTLHEVGVDRAEESRLESYSDPDALLYDEVSNLLEVPDGEEDGEEVVNSDGGTVVDILSRDQLDALFVQGSTTSRDFPGLALMLNLDEDFVSARFEIEVHDDGMIFVEGKDLFEAFEEVLLDSEEINLLEESQTRRPDQDEEVESDEEAVSEDAEVEENDDLSLLEDEDALKGAAVSDEEAEENVEEEGGAILEEVLDSEPAEEIADAEETLEESADLDAEEATEASKRLEEVRVYREVFEGRYDKVIINPAPEQFDVQYEDSEQGIRVQFFDKESGALQMSFDLDLVELAEYLITKRLEADFYVEPVVNVEE